MKKYHIPIIVSAIIVSSYFVLEPSIIPEQNTSKNCTIPHDVNFIGRDIISSSQDGKHLHSIKGDFSIHHTVPIDEYRIDDSTHLLILKPVPYSHGYVIMCNPLPVLEKRFEKQLDDFMILVDGEEVEPSWVNDALRINVNNNTRIEIIGFSFVGGGK